MHVFIVGAPRCGTTALSRYLKAHPDICFAKPKEPQYFSTVDLRGLDGAALDRRLSADYLARFFRPRDPGRQTFAEGSVSYLYSADAIRTIRRWNPAARLIVMLRDPMAMLRSYHARLCYLLDEDEPDFARAWALQGERRAGRRIPAMCRDPQMLAYGEVARLGAHTQQLLEIAGPSRVLPVLHDDLVADPRGVYRQVLTFIGVADDGRTDFPKVRASSAFRSRALQRLLQRPPAPVARLAAGGPHDARETVPVAATGGHAGARRFGPRRLRKRLLAWNTVTRPKAALDPAVRAEIRDTFVDDVVQLEAAIGRDLGHWLDGAVAEARPESRKRA